MSVLNTLTEGIRARSLANEGEALLEKWEKTGLLEGLDDNGRSNMARLLENQAAQLLKESSTMAAGDVGLLRSCIPNRSPCIRSAFGTRPRVCSTNEPPIGTHFLPRLHLFW